MHGSTPREALLSDRSVSSPNSSPSTGSPARNTRCGIAARRPPPNRSPPGRSSTNVSRRHGDVPCGTPAEQEPAPALRMPSARPAPDDNRNEPLRGAMAPRSGLFSSPRIRSASVPRVYSPPLFPTHAPRLYSPHALPRTPIRLNAHHSPRTHPLPSHTSAHSPLAYIRTLPPRLHPHTPPPHTPAHTNSALPAEGNALFFVMTAGCVASPQTPPPSLPPPAGPPYSAPPRRFIASPVRSS